MPFIIHFLSDDNWSHMQQETMLKIESYKICNATLKAVWNEHYSSKNGHLQTGSNNLWQEVMPLLANVVLKWTLMFRICATPVYWQLEH